jgi:hypothetical protein
VDDSDEFGLGIPTRNIDGLSFTNTREVVLVLDCT